MFSLQMHACSDPLFSPFGIVILLFPRTHTEVVTRTDLPGEIMGLQWVSLPTHTVSYGVFLGSGPVGAIPRWGFFHSPAAGGGFSCAHAACMVPIRPIDLIFLLKSCERRRGLVKLSQIFSLR